MRNWYRRVLIVMSCVLLLGACGENRTINNVRYGQYGPLSPSSQHNPNIEYEVVWGNVIWSVIFSETIIVPVILLGFYLWEPVAAMPPNHVPGQVG